METGLCSPYIKSWQQAGSLELSPSEPHVSLIKSARGASPGQANGAPH